MIKKFFLIAAVTLLYSCVKSSDFESLETNCSNDLIANTAFSKVKDLYQGELLQIQEDLVLEGYVISSDKEGNFFSVLHFQDNAVNPSEGLQIEIDLFESHLFFESGNKILIKLKGLYLGKSKGVFKLGGTFNAFGNATVGRLPALKIPEHIFLSCDESAEIRPKSINLEDLEENNPNTLIKIEGLEFAEAGLGKSFAIEKEETEQILQDCKDNNIIMRNSGFANFQAEIVPEGNGAVTGVLLKENADFFVVIRDLEDVNFENERCPEVITEFTSTNVLISELADPNNNAGARFVELYNAASEPLDLNGWMLRRYTNDHTEVSSLLDLSGFVIAAETTFVISSNASEFEVVYGFPPDMGVSTNSPADSNGDDNLELVDPFGTVIDVFGVIGEDGSGTNHEFEDGRAIRNSNVAEGNPTYTFLEWMIFNDTGDSGTVNQPQNAPEDFSPGSRE